MSDRSLLVFAHADEAAAFTRARVPHLITGVGKVNAALELTHAILDLGLSKLDRVIVLGTAGAITETPRLDTVYRISAALQHDYSLPSPVISLDGYDDVHAQLETAIIATGDVFVQDDEQRASIAQQGASLVDMESYAYASVCKRLGAPLQIFKTPSDFADSATSQETWDGVVVSKSEQLLRFAGEYLPELFR